MFLGASYFPHRDSQDEVSGNRSSIHSSSFCMSPLSGSPRPPPPRRVADRFFAGTPRRRGSSRARTGGKCTPHYSCLDELAPVVFVATGGKQNAEKDHLNERPSYAALPSQSSKRVGAIRASSPGTSDWSFSSAPK